MTLRPIDADNHYYESLDAFTRHLHPDFRRRGVRVLMDGGRPVIVAGGKVNRFIPNPSFDPVIVPGCLDLLFRGQVPPGVDPRSLSQVEPIHTALRPPAEALEWARRVLAADAASPGAARLDGRMVDRPVVLQAQRTLALARD